MPSMNVSAAIELDDASTLRLEHFVIPHHYSRYLDSVLIPSGLIQSRIEKIAQDITTQYKGAPIHFLCVLKGASEFFHDLMRNLQTIYKFVECDYVPITFDFIRVKSYEGTESSGSVRIIGEDVTKLQGKHVVLVEDIIDTGRTMSELIPLLQKQQPASIKVASLLEKKRNGVEYTFHADFVGFCIPDKFVVGYCLDYNETFRDLDHICVINEKGIKALATS